MNVNKGEIEVEQRHELRHRRDIEIVPENSYEEKVFDRAEYLQININEPYTGQEIFNNKNMDAVVAYGANRFLKGLRSIEEHFSTGREVAIPVLSTPNTKQIPYEIIDIMCEVVGVQSARVEADIQEKLLWRTRTFRVEEAMRRVRMLEQWELGAPQWRGFFYLLPIR